MAPAAFMLFLVLWACKQGSAEFTATTGGGSPGEPASFVVILVDDWALSDLEAVRTDANPWNDMLAVDLLAAIGQRWTNFYSQPVCNPTRSTLMHGRLIGSSQGGVCNLPNAKTPTPNGMLASLLHDAGYATAAFGKWHIARDPDPLVPWVETPASYGFDAWRAWNASNVNGHCGSKGYEDWHRVDDGVESRSLAYHTEAVATAFLDRWQVTHGPRLAYVCFQAPHVPLHHPPAHLLPAGYPESTTNRERYEAMLVALDTMLASMLAVIDMSDTYVLLLGDNGTPLDALRSDQRRARVKASTFEDGVNVPFLVAGPGITVGETEAVGHVVDLPATLAQLAGVPVPFDAIVDSISLAPVMEDPSARVRDHVLCDRLSEVLSVTPFGDVLTIERTSCVVLDTRHGLLKGKYDYEETYDVLADELVIVKTEAFFDLAADPGETNRLASNDPLHSEDMDRIRELWAEYTARE